MIKSMMLLLFCLPNPNMETMSNASEGGGPHMNLIKTNAAGQNLTLSSFSYSVKSSFSHLAPNSASNLAPNLALNPALNLALHLTPNSFPNSFPNSGSNSGSNIGQNQTQSSVPFQFQFQSQNQHHKQAHQFSQSSSQEKFELAHVINTSFSSIEADKMGFCYVTTEQQNLLKLSSKGDTLYSFEDKSFLVSHVDASNPLKVLVYDRNQNTIKFLDKTLTPINSPISLDDLQIPVSNAVASSRDNLFWVFDDNVQELKKYSRHMKEVANSGNITALTGKNIQPTAMCESNANVYLLDTVQGVFQFDYLGTFLFHFKKIRAEKIKVMGTKILYLKNKELHLYDTILLDEQKIDLNEPIAVLDFAVGKNSIFVLTVKGIRVHRVVK